MAVKYTLNVNSQKNQDWLVEIDFPSYTGDPIPLVGDRDPILIEYKGGSNDTPFNHIIPQSATFRVYDDNVDIPELQEIDDASVKCRVYLNSQLKHQGFIISDGIQETDSGVSSLMTIKSIDGLELLDAIPYRINNYGAITVDGQVSDLRCPMNIVRSVLYESSNLDNKLPIRWASSVKSEQYPDDDMLAGRNTIIPDGKLLLYFNYSGYWYLENIMKSAHCWLYQRDGYWWIENRGDTIRNGGVFNGYEITTSTGSQVATPINIDLNTSDLSLEFINNDAYWMVKKPLGGVSVVYNDSKTQNSIPNGGFDQWPTGMLADWGFQPVVGDSPSYIEFGSLTEREGSSVQLTNNGTATEDAIFTLSGSIPVDTHYLFRSMQWGFTFMPLFGFDTDSNGAIAWDSPTNPNPLKVSMSFEYNGQTWYLNEFGFWQDQGRGLDLGVIFVNMEIERGGVAPNYSDTYKAVFEGSPNVGDVLVISIKNEPGGTHVDYSFTVTPTEEGNLELALNGLMNALPNSVDGWNIFNKRVEMDNPTRGKVRFAHVMFLSRSVARTYKSGATQEFRFIFPYVQNMKLQDIATFSFTGRGGNSNILLPDIGENPSAGNGKLNIFFHVKPGQQYVLDDVYMNFQDNHDKYDIRVSGSKSPIENHELGISSSFTGFMWSSFMNSFSTSDLALNWGVNYGGGNINYQQASATVLPPVAQQYAMFFDWYTQFEPLVLLGRTIVLEVAGNIETFTFVASPNTSGNQLPAQTGETNLTVFLNNIKTYLEYNPTISANYTVSTDDIDQLVILTDNVSGENRAAVDTYNTQGVQFFDKVFGANSAIQISGASFPELRGYLINYKTSPSAIAVNATITGNSPNTLYVSNPPAEGIYPEFQYYIYDNLKNKSLTQLYGEFVLDWMNKPSKIFEGSIDRIVECGEFITIKGRKYVVLNASIQGDGITRVTAFEASINPIPYSVEHKSTIENNN